MGSENDMLYWSKFNEVLIKCYQIFMKADAIFSEKTKGYSGSPPYFSVQKRSKLELTNFLNWIYTSKTTSAKLISSD